MKHDTVVVTLPRASGMTHEVKTVIFLYDNDKTYKVTKVKAFCHSIQTIGGEWCAAYARHNGEFKYIPRKDIAAVTLINHNGTVVTVPYQDKVKITHSSRMWAKPIKSKAPNRACEEESAKGNTTPQG